MKYIIAALAFLLVLSAALHAADVEVSWAPNTESDLAGYKIYYGTAPGVYEASVDVGLLTKKVITLTPAYGSTCYFAVTAYDTSGNESGYSEEVSVFVPDKIAPAPAKSIFARLMEAIVAWFKGFFGLTSVPA